MHLYGFPDVILSSGLHFHKRCVTDPQIDGWTDGQTQTDGRMDGRMDGQTKPLTKMCQHI